MPKFFTYQFVLCAVLIFITAFVSHAQQPNSAGNAPAEHAGKAVLKLKSVDGQSFDLASMRGRVVLLSFGATWCQPCATELGILEELKREYADKPVSFLWVSVEGKTEKSDAQLRQYAGSLNLSMPVLRDSEQTVYKQFATIPSRMRLPMVLFFDVENRFVGPPQVGIAAPDKYKERVRSALDGILQRMQK